MSGLVQLQAELDLALTKHVQRYEGFTIAEAARTLAMDVLSPGQSAVVTVRRLDMNLYEYKIPCTKSAQHAVTASLRGGE